jgi:hypothetical protein
MSKLRDLIEDIVPCHDCGGYVSDHMGVQGDCNYEDGAELVDKTIKSLQEMGHFPDLAEKCDMAFGLKCDNNHLINKYNYICKICVNTKATEWRRKKLLKEHPNDK